MTCNNKIYLTSKTLYYQNNDQIYELSFNDDIIYKLNKHQFMMKYQLFLKNHKLGAFLFNKNITIIYNSLLSKHDIEYISNLFNEIGYKNVILISDISLINVDKKNDYLLIDHYDKFIFLDSYNQKRVIVFDRHVLSFNEELNIIYKRLKKRNLIIIGQVDESMINTSNYYIYENSAQFFLTIDS